MDLIEKELSYKIRGAVFEVSKQLGAGFLEKVYERALLIELQSMGLTCEAQPAITVKYKGYGVGEFFADIIVENRIIIELKAQSQLQDANKAQLINYLKASEFKLGFLVNFTHPKAEIKRFIL